MLYYQDIWNKVLKEGEEVGVEFTVGKKYRSVIKFLFVLFGILFLFVAFRTGLLMIIFGFASDWYLKKANAFAFTDKRVLIHRGYFSTSLTSVNYDKITDVVVIQDFLEKQFYQTGTLVINTAGTASHEVVLRYIEEPYEFKKKLDVIRDKVA